MKIKKQSDGNYLTTFTEIEMEQLQSIVLYLSTPIEEPKTLKDCDLKLKEAERISKTASRLLRQLENKIDRDAPDLRKDLEKLEKVFPKLKKRSMQ